MAEVQQDSIAVSLISELTTVDQLMRARLSKALPRGMELSHFQVLSFVARTRGERSPAQLARTFHVTKAAMTNTIGKLERAGYLHVRPDWDDARRKFISISPAGIRAYEFALAAISPIFDELLAEVGRDSLKSALPVLRRLRTALEKTD